MFEDLHEQENAFGLLDDWAGLPIDYDLTWKTGNKSPFDKKITELMLSVQEQEQKTINKNPNRNLTLGFSYQSKLLARLWFSLNNANTSAKLLANLLDIKELLFKAMIIGRDIKSGNFELIEKQLHSYRKGRTKDSISPLHKELATIYKNAGQPNFTNFIEALSNAIDEYSCINDFIVLQELDDIHLFYAVHGKEKTIRLESIRTKIADYKKWILKKLI